VTATTDAPPSRAPEGRRDGSPTFAAAAVVVAAIAFVLAVLGVVRSGGGGSSSRPGADDTAPVGTPVDLDDGAVADPSADAAAVTESAAAAMAEVSSVEFSVACEGAPVHIDEFERIALTGLRGQFVVPGRAQAELAVTIDGDLRTRLGAVAVGTEIWLSNPVTGEFETLPEGYDIDPSRFFDPKGGWRPLLAGLQDLTLVGIDDRGGERYHVRGTATSQQMSDVTAGLVDDQDVVVDLWIHPTTSLVTAAGFDTTTAAGTTSWSLELGRYGDTFRIDPPEGVDLPAVDAPSPTGA